MAQDQRPEPCVHPSPATGENHPMRAAAEINLAAIGSNVLRLKAAAGDSELLAVVKADGYGHGMVPSARAARAAEPSTWGRTARGGHRRA